MKIYALLFDLDGTLTNSEPAWFAACNETLRYYGKNKIEKEVYERDFVGTTVMKNIVKMFPEFSPTELKKAEGMYKDEFEKRLGQILIKEHVIDILELVKRKKLKCGLVTNTSRSIVNKVLTKFGIEEYFQVIVCEGDTARAKPFPDPVIKGCELLRVVPNETIYVEDSVTGVMAGKASGCFTVAVTASMEKEFLKEAGADLVLDNIGQLWESIEDLLA
ncbi:MAG: HAD family phosphatase [candidate division Zixibacteria bacterium]|nr:HAD family phosphatase [candidate division Zixibacteria bacterium]